MQRHKGRANELARHQTLDWGTHLKPATSSEAPRRLHASAGTERRARIALASTAGVAAGAASFAAGRVTGPPAGALDACFVAGAGPGAFAGPLGTADFAGRAGPTAGFAAAPFAGALLGPGAAFAGASLVAAFTSVGDVVRGTAVFEPGAGLGDWAGRPFSGKLNSERVSLPAGATLVVVNVQG